MRASLRLESGDLILTSPFDRGLVEELKRVVPGHDRLYLPATKQWRIKYMWGTDVARLVKQHLGETIEVPRQITSSRPQRPETRLFRVEYIGSVRDREDGSLTASGFTNGGWNLILPLATLQAWFGQDSKPDEAPTLYAVLGCKPKATPEEVKKAYRLSARTWHPDVNKDPSAHEQFIKIQQAYETLSDGQKRKRYDAGLFYERDYQKRESRKNTVQKWGWQPPVRCGFITVKGQESVGRFIVEAILDWQEIKNQTGQTMVSFWPTGSENFISEWI